MRKLLKAELYKLLHGKELPICIAASFVLPVLMIVVGGYENGKLVLTTESREIIGLVIGALFAVTYVGKDFTSKTIHHALTSGAGRGQVLGSKFVSYQIACFFLLILNILAMGGGYSIFYGWGQRFTGEELFFAAVYSLSGIFFDLCILSVPFFICVLLRSQALSMAASFGMIGLAIALSQMPWTYIAMQAAERRFGAVQLIYFLCFFLAVGILYAASLCYFKKQDIL